MSRNGYHIWTGDSHQAGKKPNKAQQEQQTQFWELYDAQMAQGKAVVLVDMPAEEEVGGNRFPDALPEHSQTDELLPMFVTTPTRLPEPALT